MVFYGMLRTNAEDWRPVAAVPSSLSARFQTIGGITYAEQRATLTDSGVRLGSVGPLIRRGSKFFRDVTFLRSSSQVVLPVLSEVIFSLILGPLTNGNYSFTCTSFGTNVSTVAFQVPANADGSDYTTKTIYQYQMLTNGTFKLNVAVPFAHTATTQMSTNLIDWSNISTNEGGAIWPDADAIFEPAARKYPQRFYRVLIQ